MQILVTGKQIDVGDALRRHVEDRLSDGIAKYFSNPIEAHVVFGPEGHGYRVDCSVHVGQGIDAHAHATAAEIYAGFDAAADRLEKRLRRYKRRLREHGNGVDRAVPAGAGLTAQSYVLAPEVEHEDEVEGEFRPVIVAESTRQVHRRTVGEAVMEMDLADQPVVLFRNAGNGHLNVVYRRPDGHIGWIDLVDGGGGVTKD
jgi:ribosomal subunit interface protein